MNGYDKSKNPDMWIKYETHLQTFDLNGTFSAKASEEMDNCKQYYQDLLHSCDEIAVKKAISEKRISCENNDFNSWGAALYRELEREIHAYCVWLL